MVHDTGDELIWCDILFSDREQQNRQCNHSNNSGEIIGCQATYAIFIIVQVIECIFIKIFLIP